MRALFIFLITLLTTSAHAGVISIVIDDIGYNQYLGSRAVNLPASVTLSILPETPHADQLYEEATQAGHEVMLHIPMQASVHVASEPSTLTLSMNEQELKEKLYQFLSLYPTIAGLNNHMGSEMTSSKERMNWFMQVLSETDQLFFVDSRTTKHTVAESTASEYFIPSTRRDIFLDNDPQDREAIRAQLKQLIHMAKTTGFALAIGHPHKNTLDILEQELPLLTEQEYELVPVSEYIQRKQQTDLPKPIFHEYEENKAFPSRISSN